jgi:hypothetical protein
VSDPIEIYRHPAKPEWGRGILVEERESKLILHWEDGAEHAVGSAYRDRLEAVEVPEDEAAQLAEQILGQRTKSLRAIERSRARSTRKRTTARPAARIAFEEQLRRFEVSFPGGFRGEAFERAERGIGPGGEPIEGSRQAAVAMAREILSPSAFGEPAAVFEACTRLLGSTNLVHPFEGPVRFKTIVADDRPRFAEALGEVLHGGGDYGHRFERYVEALAVRSAGRPTRPTWPLSTIFQGLLAPEAHLFVKPKLLQEQAVILHLDIQYSPQPTSSVYEQFRAVSAALGERLAAAGQQPRDMLDVAAFVWSTLAPPPKPDAAEPAASGGPAEGAEAASAGAAQPAAGDPPTS